MNGLNLISNTEKRFAEIYVVLMKYTRDHLVEIEIKRVKLRGYEKRVTSGCNLIYEIKKKFMH